VKSYDTEPAAQALAPLMGRDTAVVTLQNGVDNVEAIGSVVGSGAVLAGAVYVALQLASPSFGGAHREAPLLQRVQMGPAGNERDVVAALCDECPVVSTDPTRPEQEARRLLAAHRESHARSRRVWW